MSRCCEQEWLVILMQQPTSTMRTKTNNNHNHSNNNTILSEECNLVEEDLFSYSKNEGGSPISTTLSSNLLSIREALVLVAPPSSSTASTGPGSIKSKKNVDLHCSDDEDSKQHQQERQDQQSQNHELSPRQQQSPRRHLFQPHCTKQIPTTPIDHETLTLVRRICREDLIKEDDNSYCNIQFDDEDSSHDSSTTRVIRKRCTNRRRRSNSNSNTITPFTNHDRCFRPRSLSLPCEPMSSTSLSLFKQQKQSPIHFDLDFLLRAKRFISSPVHNHRRVHNHAQKDNNDTDTKRHLTKSPQLLGKSVSWPKLVNLDNNSDGSYDDCSDGLSSISDSSYCESSFSDDDDDNVNDEDC